MGGEISRRTFLRGTLAGAVVVAGFDTGLRSWVSAAELGQRAATLAEDAKGHFDPAEILTAGQGVF